MATQIVPAPVSADDRGMSLADHAAYSYRIDWDAATLSWRLTYGSQVWATVCAYLPGQPAKDARAATVWADEILRSPQPWQRDGAGYRAAPVRQVA